MVKEELMMKADCAIRPIQVSVIPFDPYPIEPIIYIEHQYR